MFFSYRLQLMYTQREALTNTGSDYNNKIMKFINTKASKQAYIS